MSFIFWGIAWRVSFFFFAILAVFIVIDGGGMAQDFILAALLHEIGHLLAMLTLGVGVEKVELSMGGIIINHSRHCKSSNELIVLLCGPVFNLLMGALLYYCGYDEFSVANTSIAIYHLMPLKGLDGWSVLHSTAVCLWGVGKGEVISEIISAVFVTMLVSIAVIAVVLYGVSAIVLRPVAIVVVYFISKKIFSV